MKKTILKMSILLSVFAIMVTSCSKDDAELPDQLGGKYTLIMNGKTVEQGDTDEVGLLGNAASVSQGENFGIVLTNVPESTGGITQLDNSNTGGSVSIMGKNILLNDNSDELYFSISGTIERESATKITFNGTCTALGSTTVITFSGTIESEAFKLI